MGKKVLLVEDDLFLRELYKKILEKREYIVEYATDGEEAAKKILAGGYDLILLDIMLPKSSGLEVLKKARGAGSASKDTPIILLTNLADENIIKQGLTGGADGYLLKAELNPSDVVNEIELILQSRKAKL